MKLPMLVPEMEKRFSRINNLKEYATVLKSRDIYKDYNARLAWDCIRATFTPAEIWGWYDVYECNDSHITTAAKAALRNMSII